MSTKDLTGRNILVTGANTGIGKATAEVLADRGARVIFACRSREKTMPVVDAVIAKGGVAEFVALDLADFESVRACATGWLARNEPLHVLLNNAGLAGLRGVTKQGFELTFGTNHLGHFLLTQLLLPKLRETATRDLPSRIINVASKAHYEATGIDWDALRKPTASRTGLAEYSVSKLANVLFTKELARGKAGSTEDHPVRSYALHPGVVASDAWRQVPWPIRPIMKMFMISNEDGAKTSVMCATDPALKDQDGLYYDDSKEKKPSHLAEDAALANELWERSEAWTAET
jgi:retinol dehydrogenase-12